MIKFKLFFLLLLVLFSVSNSIAQMNSSSDKGYLLYKDHEYEKAIQFWESNIPRQNAKYTQQANYLIGLSHLQLARLYDLASEIVNKTALNYYKVVKELDNKDEMLLNFYEGLTAFEIGDYERSVEKLSDIKKSRYINNDRLVISKIWLQLAKSKKNSSQFQLNKYKNEIEYKYAKYLKDSFISNISNVKGNNTKLNRDIKNKMILNVINREVNKSRGLKLKYDLSGIELVDNTVENRDLKYYDPNIFTALKIFHLFSAEEKFLLLINNSQGTIVTKSSELLAEVWFMLNKFKECIQFSNENPGNEIVFTFALLSKYQLGSISSLNESLKKLTNYKSAFKSAYYLARNNKDLKLALRVSNKALKMNSSSRENIFACGYVLIKNNDVENAEELLDKLYSRERIIDFSKNSPIVSLLYSYCLLKKSPNNACVEVGGMAERLSFYFRAFSQYHNYIQGFCITLADGNGDLNFD